MKKNRHSEIIELIENYDGDDTKSMLANNTMEYNENEIIPMLDMAFMGMIGAIKTEETQQ